jgi:hypothetical protein
MNFDWNRLTIDVVLLGLGFLGGIVTSYAQGWVGYHFKVKQEKRSRTQRIVDQLSEIISQAVMEDWTSMNNGPSKHSKYIYKTENQLRALGHNKLANSLKEFMKLWYTMEEYGFDLGSEHFSGISLPPEVQEDFQKNDRKIREISKYIISFKAK